jgi:hypothetical protein
LSGAQREPHDDAPADVDHGLQLTMARKRSWLVMLASEFLNSLLFGPGFLIVLVLLVALVALWKGIP